MGNGQREIKTINAFELYLTNERRRRRNVPRPMNSFMILTLIVRNSYLEWRDITNWAVGEVEIREIFLKLQKDIKIIHTQYDYRPMSSRLPNLPKNKNEELTKSFHQMNANRHQFYNYLKNWTGKFY
ncbi:hypothetical protein Glove_139g360 [Diversispora epigaea]|uniref:Uncharacterized protein n=1 Tax=Diversispora epigaea TaxID=1348612 RepID=A0A397J513_9GLOM|nr:hypothetical protein Glove_139g360 [Diversispora epigaea]